MKVEYLHAMVRVTDLEESKRFYCDLLGMEEVRRSDNEQGKYTLVFVAPPGQHDRPIEMTYNWDSDETYDNGRNFGHLAVGVENIYEMCERLQKSGVAINRPPRDGRMAFVKSPDGVSIELLQMGDALEKTEPWASMENTGSW